ncbi:hypothetical protein FD722_17500 [Photobacterium damselae subsp. damselae]|uniref:oligosaccharide repeat unit polymerase n=1 Tax=Photobacterium damselae TaxID=38293 RepID=UPI0010FDD194|nr:oligosaccharide repeat unit polymerase [Photobacterium damselae]TLS80841.1 hypothetical protein FD719_17515 [Photobacterium damselae subsp. damselae]TLS87214.1 hypothetical protein FD722_17500 [Photobacterium damselae subsp. damselae]
MRIDKALFLLYGMTYICILGGVFSYSEYNLLNVNYIFEISILVIFITGLRENNYNIFFIALVLVLYLIIRLFINNVYFNVGFKDLIVSNKFVLYLIILSLLNTKGFFNVKRFNIFYNILLLSFFVKYLLWHVLSGMRPGLFVENNFELMFLLLVTISYINVFGKLSGKQYISLFLIFFMSFSRSGIVCLLFFVFIRSLKKINIKTIFSLILVFIISCFAVFIFLDRIGSGGIESIDRFVFFKQFLYSVKDWGYSTYIFGEYILNPLPNSVCSTLSFYETLFSNYSQNICYSVIFHSFILRVIYDFGFSGLILVFYYLYLLIREHINTRLSIIALGIIFLNGMSVSSINSVYCFIGLLFILLTSNKNSGMKL